MTEVNGPPAGMFGRYGNDAPEKNKTRPGEKTPRTGSVSTERGTSRPFRGNYLFEQPQEPSP